VKIHQSCRVAYVAENGRFSGVQKPVPIGVAIWNIACKLEAAREAMNQDS
jgi:hypothetical protein